MADERLPPSGERTPTRNPTLAPFSVDNMPVNINAQAQIPGQVSSVLREFMPRLDRPVPVISPSEHHGHEHNPPPRLINPDNPAAPGESFVVDIDQQDQAPANEEHRPPAEGEEETSINWRTLAKASETSIVFVILLLAKVMYNHRLGVLICIGLLSVFYHASSTLKKQIAFRDSRHIDHKSWKLIWVIVFLLGNIIIIYVTFEKEELYKSLYFGIPRVASVDFWTLLWIIGLTDFVLKFAAIILKACIALLPKTCLSYNRRGKYYMFVEEVIQYYRCLTPIVPWYYYLSEEHKWFSGFLLIVYCIFKANLLWLKSKELWKAWIRMRMDVRYGDSPSGDELKAAEGSCPICHDNFTDAVILSCKHIFCEDCVSMWFDREQTCPMCRAKIADDPAWRDGSTNGFVQWF